MSAPLEPVDPARCQAEISYYRPFVMGGSVRGWERCGNKPHWIAQEVKPGADGQCGGMSLCDDCAKVFIEKQTLPPDAYELEWVGTDGVIEKFQP